MEAGNRLTGTGRWSVGDLLEYLEGAAADADAGTARKARVVHTPLPNAGRADAVGPKQRQRQGNACRGRGLRNVLRIGRKKYTV